jgi:hypothetical protein
MPGRRDRWRADAGPRESTSLAGRRIAWTLASLLLVGVIATIVVLWTWRIGEPHTAILHVSIDGYDVVTKIAPLPYGVEDTTALEAIALDEWRTVQHPAGTDTAEQLRNLDPGKNWGSRSIGKGDVFIASIRGQSIVVPASARNRTRGDGAENGTSGGEWLAALLPEDFDVGSGTVAKAVPLETIVGRLLGTPAATTLVAIDLGDLRFDPRLGVLAGLVPGHIEAEIPDWKLPDRRDAGRSAWLLTSHDTFEFSGVSIAARRSYFSRALELAIAGRADEKEFGGDGDRWVELDELVRFVTVQTDAWARGDNGDARGQRPVLWRLFDRSGSAARVEADAIPEGIRITRSNRPRAPRPLPTALIQGKADREDRAAGAFPPAPPEASAPVSATPGPAGGEPAATPPPSDDMSRLWRLLDAVAGRAGRGETARWPIAGSGDKPREPNVLAYAPHLWRALEARTVVEEFADAFLERRVDQRGRWTRTAPAIVRWAEASTPPAPEDEEPLLKRLAEARRRVFDDPSRQWRSNDKDVRDAVETLDLAITTAWDLFGWQGASAGGVGEVSLASWEPWCTSITQLRQALEKVDDTDAEGRSWRRELIGPTNTLRTVLVRMRELPTGRFAEALNRAEDHAARGGRFRGSADLVAMAGSRVATADHRKRIADLLRSLRESGGTESVRAPSGADEEVRPEGKAGSPKEADTEATVDVEATSPADRWLPPIASLRLPERRRPEASTWERIATHAEILGKLYALGGGPGAADPMDGAAEAIRAAKRDDARALRATLEAARTFAVLLGDAVPVAAAETAASPLGRVTIDRALRRIDPRDVDRAGTGPRVAGWWPHVQERPLVTTPVAAPKAAPTMTLVATSEIGGTVGKRHARERRTERTVLPVGVGERSWSGEKAVVLHAFPARTTAWTLALTNGTGTPRDVRVELVRVLDPRPEDPAEARTLAWPRFVDAVAADGDRLPRGAKVIALIERVGLAAGAATPLPPLAPATPAASEARRAEDDTSRPPTAPTGEETGSLLALVVRDLPRGTPPPPDGDGRTASLAPELPGDEARTWVMPIAVGELHPREYVDADAELTGDVVRIRVRAVDAAVIPETGITVTAADRPGAGARRQNEGGWLVLEKPTTVLVGEREQQIGGVWKGPSGESIRIALDVDGHPRSHVFEISKARERVPPEQSWAGIAIRSPVDRQPFGNDAAIPLALAIDFPYEAGAKSLAARVAVQNVGRSGGDPEPRWTRGTDRSITHRLAVPEGATLAVTTEVADWEVDIEPGMRDTDARILATVTGDPAADTDADRRDARTIVIDGRKPGLESLVARGAVVKGKPFEWKLRVTDGDGRQRDRGGQVGSSGIERVEWDFDDKRKDVLTEPRKSALPRGDGTVTIEVPTNDLATGPHRVVARVFDAVGHESNLATLDLDVNDPPAPPKETMAKGEGAGDPPPKPKPNTLVVTVTLNGQPSKKEVAITVKGPQKKETKSTSGGQATFTGLPPGEYTIEGPQTVILNNKIHTASQATTTVTVEPAPKPKAEATIAYQ